MRKIFVLLLASLMLVSAMLAFTSCGEEPAVYSDYVALEIENYGTIVIELYKLMAPGTVYNFQKLVSQGFYDGLTFHRIVPGFMIQGGDPMGNGSGGSSETIYGEMMSNGFKQNTLKHTPGVVSMARSSSGYNTASSQFFIMTETNPNLDGEYAAFGKVVEGMDVVEAISKTATDLSETDSWGTPIGGKPLTPVKITKAYFVENYVPVAES